MPGSGSSHHGRGRPEQLRFGIEDDYDESPRRGQRVQRDAPLPHSTHTVFSPDVPPALPTESSLAGMVFVPTEPMSQGSTQARLQMRRMQDGRLAVLAYTSLDLLVAGCGPHQGWMAAPAEQLTVLQPLAGFDVIALNVELPDDSRVDVAGHAKAQNGASR
jgi:hypothetical protein